MSDYREKRPRDGSKVISAYQKRSPTPKMRLFASIYCGEAKGVGSKAYELSTVMSPPKLLQKEENPKAFAKYCSDKAYELLQDERTLVAIKEEKSKKNKAFWLSEEDILSGLYMEATNVEVKSSQAARIQAWVWLGKHIGMFSPTEGRGAINAEAKQAANAAPTYNIVQYNTITPTKIEEGVHSANISKEDQEPIPIENTLDISITDYKED